MREITNNGYGCTLKIIDPVRRKAFQLVPADVDVFGRLVSSILVVVECLYVLGTCVLHAAEHVVVEAGKRLRVVALDLSAPRKNLLDQIQSIADRVRIATAKPAAAVRALD